MFFREVLLLLFTSNLVFSFVNKPLIMSNIKLKALERDSEIYVKFEKYSREKNYEKQYEYLQKIWHYLQIKKEFNIYENKLLNDEDISDCPISFKDKDYN